MYIVKLFMTNQMIYIISNEGDRFSIAKSDFVRESYVASTMESDELEIDVPDASSNTIKNIIKFIEIQNNDRFVPLNDDDKPTFQISSLKKIHMDFLKSYTIDELNEILLTANFLDMKSLIDLICAYYASIMKTNTVEKIREIFDIKNDFSLEEEQQIHSENQWCA